MNFSNKFKICWWIILLVISTIANSWSLFIGLFNIFNILILIFWFILVLFPIISEISIGGISVKKDIENAKKEIKEQIGEIKNEIRNYINFKPTINFNIAQANQTDYQNKVEEEVREESERIEKKQGEKAFRGDENLTKKQVGLSGNMQEKLNRAFMVEKLVLKKLSDVYGDNFKERIKIGNQSKEDSLIVDGILSNSEGIMEIIETKLITAKSFNHIFYILLNFIKKVIKLRINTPIRFIIVSEAMNDESAQQINEQVAKLNCIGKTCYSIPRIVVEYFKLENEKLIEIKI